MKGLRPNSLLQHQSNALPRLRLELIEWEIVAGESEDPVYFSKAFEVGSADDRDSGTAQKIIWEWYSGASVQNHVLFLTYSQTDMTSQLVFQ